MSRILVVGVDHFIQNLRSRCQTGEDKGNENKQREALKSRLEDLIVSREVQLVAEEATPDGACLGKLLSAAHACKYCDLTMRPEERERRGIKDDYNVSVESRRVAYRTFEEYMFEVVQRSRQKATSILIICGSYHAKNVAQLFLNVGDEVMVEDTTSAPWYRGHWEFLKSMEDDTPFRAGVRKGTEQADRGEFIEEEEMDARVKRMFEP
jgi:hypothetical protein